jgi:glycogen synthase
VAASRYCDNIFAVGDYVVKELRFLRKEFANVHIDLAYNGVPARALTAEQKMKSRRVLQKYAGNLLGFEPDYVFTHVTRLVPSKGLWRDIRVLEHLEKHMARENKTAVLFVLSTETIGRARHDVEVMERWHKWPVAHREGHPDLTGGEAAYYAGVQEWNAKARFCKIVYVNQFVVNAQSLGNRAPAEMDFLDFRKGSDAEFGQSIYEPFGIAQVEPISFGGICVFTQLCGCAGFVRKAAAAVGGGKAKECANALEVDYTKLPERLRKQSVASLMSMDLNSREEIEQAIAGEVAAELFKRLPRTAADFERLLANGAKLGAEMNWDAVAKNYVLPGMDRAMAGGGGA